MSVIDPRHLKGSEVRLWQLIDERTRPGADVERIDQRIWDLFGEDWAIMFTDLAGFSRQVAAFGIIHFLQIIHEQSQILLPLVAQHDGILIKTEADSYLIIFKRAASSLRCAIDMQHACQAFNQQRKPEDKVLLCVGLGFGRILRIGDVDVFGKEVNAASKLGEDTAKADEILVTQTQRDAAGDVDGIEYVSIDHQVAGSEQNYRVEYAKFRS
jgi:adenylate cyclase